MEFSSDLSGARKTNKLEMKKIVFFFSNHLKERHNTNAFDGRTEISFFHFQSISVVHKNVYFGISMYLHYVHRSLNTRIDGFCVLAAKNRWLQKLKIKNVNYIHSNVHNMYNVEQMNML